MIASSQRPRGFTLIELMVSMAIGMIILLVATTMLASSGDGYERIGGGVTAQRDARAAISQISMDFATAKFHPGTVFQESSSSWALDNIGFLSLQPIEAQSDTLAVGDLCAINYYVADKDFGGGKIVRCLMRGFRDSQTTFGAIRTSTIPSLFAPLSLVDEPMAFGVVSFKARPVKWDNVNKQWIAWTAPNPPNPANPDPGPPAVQINLVIARRDLAAKLTTTADWDGKGNTGKLLGTFVNKDQNKNLEIYSTLILFGHE